MGDDYLLFGARFRRQFGAPQEWRASSGFVLTSAAKQGGLHGKKWNDAPRGKVV
jgi:hypothetical protein